MADPPNNRTQQDSQSDSLSERDDISPKPPTPIPIRSLFVALLILLLLVGIGRGGIWLYGTLHPQQQSSPTPGKVLATPTPEQNFLCMPGSVLVSGSSTLQPLVARVANDYTARCSQTIFTVQDGGSSAGLAQLEAGQVGIAMVDLPVSPAQPDLVDHPLVVIIFDVIINADIGVTNLTIAQLRDIYSGLDTNWRQVGGPNLPIVLFAGVSTSSIRAIFDQYVLGQRENGVPSHLPAVPNMEEAVSSTPGAIGYLPAYGVSASNHARSITIDGFQPTVSNVENGTYPFWNVEHLYTKGQPTPLEQKLLDWMDSSPSHMNEAELFCLPPSLIQPFTLSAHNATPKPA